MHPKQFRIHHWTNPLELQMACGTGRTWLSGTEIIALVSGEQFRDYELFLWLRFRYLLIFLRRLRAISSTCDSGIFSNVIPKGWVHPIKQIGLTSWNRKYLLFRCELSIWRAHVFVGCQGLLLEYNRELEKEYDKLFTAGTRWEESIV